jgi:hypothetical protein
MPIATAAGSSSRTARKSKPVRELVKQRVAKRITTKNKNATSIVVDLGMPNKAWLPRVKSRAPTRMEPEMTSNANVAIAASDPLNLEMGIPVMNAKKATTKTVINIAGKKGKDTLASKSGKYGKVLPLTAIGIVKSALTWAPTPMNATCPKLRMPVVALKLAIASAAASKIRKWVAVAFMLGPKNAKIVIIGTNKAAEASAESLDASRYPLSLFRFTIFYRFITSV